MKRAIGVVVALAVSLPPLSATAISDEDDDKLCEVIGEAPNLSVPPKDRLWFRENCRCDRRAGCGAPGTARFRARLGAAKNALEKETAAANASAAAARTRTAARARAEKEAAIVRHRLQGRVVEACKPFRACMDDSSDRDCRAERKAYEDACEPLPDYPLCQNKTRDCTE